MAAATTCDHAEWIGFSAWDMIMPLFLFVVGAAMPLSFDRRIEAGPVARARFTCKIVLRFVVLFVLGMIAQGNLLDYDLVEAAPLQQHAAGDRLRLPDRRRRDAEPADRRARCSLTAALLAGYWLLMMFVPFGGHPAGHARTEGQFRPVHRRADPRPLPRRDSPTPGFSASMTFGATVLLGVFAGES